MAGLSTSVAPEGRRSAAWAPQIGMAKSPEAGPSTSGVVVCYRVDDLAAKLQQLRDAGAIAGGTAQRPYGLESFWVDGQGTPLCLRQF